MGYEGEREERKSFGGSHSHLQRLWDGLAAAARTLFMLMLNCSVRRLLESHTEIHRKAWVWLRELYSCFCLIALFCGYRDSHKSLGVVARTLFVLLLKCSVPPCKRMLILWPAVSAIWMATFNGELTDSFDRGQVD